jgi:hypothetical protein
MPLSMTTEQDELEKSLASCKSFFNGFVTDAMKPVAVDGVTAILDGRSA